MSNVRAARSVALRGNEAKASRVRSCTAGASLNPWPVAVAAWLEASDLLGNRPRTETTRREFLRRLSAGAAGAAGWLAGSGVARSVPKLPRRPARPRLKVVVARGGQVDARLATALAPLGGIEAFVPAGSKVVIKPNAAFREPPQTGGDTTPEVVATVVRACRAAGAQSVALVEHCLSNHGLFGTDNDVSGITQAARRAGAQLIDTGNDRAMYREVTLDAPGMRTHPISRPLLEADVVINLPRLKTHPIYGYTMCMKNLMGAMRGPGSFHGSQFHHKLACLGGALQRHIALAIIDATDIVRGWAAGRPGKLTPVNALIASTSMVAADAIGLTLFGKSPLTDCKYVRIAHEMGWGPGDPANIELVEEKL